MCIFGIDKHVWQHVPSSLFTLKWNKCCINNSKLCKYVNLYVCVTYHALNEYNIGCVHMRMNRIPKDVSDRDPKRDMGRDLDRDLNCVHSHALQMPSQSRSGSAHSQGIFCSYTAQSALIDPCMASARISKMHTHKSFSERALCSHVLESRFLCESRSKMPFILRFKSLIWNSLHSQGLKSCFRIRKGPNHVPKCLLERDSLSCEQAIDHAGNSSIFPETCFGKLLKQKYHGGC